MGKCVCGTNQEQADSAFDLSPLGALRCWRLRCGMFQPSRRFLYSRARDGLPLLLAPVVVAWGWRRICDEWGQGGGRRFLL